VLLSTYEKILSGAINQADLQLYGAGRLGVYNKATSSYIYELTDHLGNVRATLRNNAGNLEVLSFADYYPHGSTMPGRSYVSSNGSKFSNYQGQEKDPETGLLNFELRQYDPRIGRWFNPDPMGQYHSPYLAMGNNPISFVDPTGGEAGDGNEDMGWNPISRSFDGNFYRVGDAGLNEFNSYFTSEFDREHFAYVGASAGSHNADGTMVSNSQWVAESHALYRRREAEKAQAKQKEEEEFLKKQPGYNLPPVISHLDGSLSYDVHGKVQEILNLESTYSYLALKGRDAEYNNNGSGQNPVNNFGGIKGLTLYEYRVAYFKDGKKGVEIKLDYTQGKVTSSWAQRIYTDSPYPGKTSPYWDSYNGSMWYPYNSHTDNVFYDGPARYDKNATWRAVLTLYDGHKPVISLRYGVDIKNNIVTKIPIITIKH
jgi:RHS repeat-associated protein